MGRVELVMSLRDRGGDPFRPEFADLIGTGEGEAVIISSYTTP